MHGSLPGALAPLKTFVCTICKIEQSADNFAKSKAIKRGFKSRCKQCDRIYYIENSETIKTATKIRYANNSKKINEYHAEYRKKNTIKVKTRHALYSKQNLDKKRINNARWSKNNPDKCQARVMFYKLTKRMATPKWLTDEQRKEIYKIYSDCRAISELLNEKFHVDHIVPIRGKIVCGLHVPWNLQIIPAKINASKNNLYWPDQP